MQPRGRTQVTNVRLRSVQKLHRVSVVESLITTPLGRINGCAQVGLSATVYFRSGSRLLALRLATVNSASVVNRNSKEPAATMAALSPSRPSAVQRVAPPAG